MLKRLVVFKKICHIKRLALVLLFNRKPTRKTSRNVFRSFDKRTPLGRKTKGLTNARLRLLFNNSSQNSTETQQKWSSSYFYKGGKTLLGSLSLGVVFLFHAGYTKNIDSV